MPGNRLSMLKICEACLQRFHPFQRKQRWCSRVCRGDVSLILICDTCGKEYRKGGAMAKRVKHHNYCSFACKFVGKRVQVTCETCGKSFQRIKAWIKPEKKNFCSKQCANLGLLVVKPLLTCNFCGIQFSRYPSEIRKMSERGYHYVFCSHRCRAAMIAAQFDPPQPYLGKHTSQPRNGHQTQIWRKAVLARDAYTCQDCGISDVLLTAHHIKAFILYPELRYDISNGLTLCYPCHERRHSLHSSHSHQPP